jgi:DNA-binding MarR family transcriptional regulator
MDVAEVINKRPRTIEGNGGGQKTLGLKESYLDVIRLIERLHRRFLDVVKADLDRLNIEDINNVQAVLLSNIETENLTIGELTNRGYYLGSNVSYNVKKLVENGYLLYERSTHDRRTTRVKLSPKGLELTAQVRRLHDRNIQAFEGAAVGVEKLDDVMDTLRVLERMWADDISYGPR